jgi:hypothetical protein
MSQYAPWNAEGLFATKSWHEDATDAQLPEPQTPPAQPPQNVVSKTYPVSKPTEREKEKGKEHTICISLK